jgi:hypothetical protein
MNLTPAAEGRSPDTAYVARFVLRPPIRNLPLFLNLASLLRIISVGKIGLLQIFELKPVIDLLPLVPLEAGFQIVYGFEEDVPDPALNGCP